MGINGPSVAERAVLYSISLAHDVPGPLFTFTSEEILHNHDGGCTKKKKTATPRLKQNKSLSETFLYLISVCQQPVTCSAASINMESFSLSHSLPP